MTGSLCRWVMSKVPYFPVKSGRTSQYFIRKILGATSLGIAFAKCEGVKDNTLLKNTLTHEQCIKQACLGSVNSASTLLTTTSAAYLDVCKEYEEALNRILSLLQELQLVEGDSPQIWDDIIEARAKVNSAKSALTELNCYMESVEKLVTATTEAAFLGGAEYVCSALCDRLNTAQREINHKITELRLLEEEYVKLQQEIATSKSNDVKKNKQNTVHKLDKKKVLL